ncbi:hypothetical protein C723_0653 [Christiangramia flava JLT2011]|uniref:Uncharacterized protein n=2 Tax=Christiangramia TaxID=292691 RepID=A0A1L7I3U3_9FLAO|nr:hypothetical protein GRFL_1119 [Christiangramia flava JLT2011]OSS40345.1 hypothetical protein C723_0653 [Christiangramia flava JLT2011]
MGTEIPGTIKKVEVEPYEMINSQTGEVAMYSKRNVFIGEGENEEEVGKENAIENNIIAEEEVI